MKTGEKYARDYKIQTTEQKTMSIDWGLAEQFQSISLERASTDHDGDSWDIFTAPLQRVQIVYEDLAPLKKETSSVAQLTRVRFWHFSSI